MDAIVADVFRARVAPLINAKALRALRCVNQEWQHVVDEVADVKGAFYLREPLTVGDVRYGVTRGLLESERDESFNACIASALPDTQWVFAALRGTREDAKSGCDSIQHIDVALWLIREHKLDPKNAFRGTCTTGSLEAAQELVAMFGLTAEDVRSGDNHALRVSCANGHLHVAQWLATTFGLTAEDARNWDNFALRYSCENGHLAVAQWLVSTFRLTVEDARSIDNHALCVSWRNGRLAVAQWLVSTFGLTVEDVRSTYYHALRASCQSDVAQLPVSTFGLTAEDAKSDNNFALCISCQNGHLDVAQWLVVEFKLTAEDAKKQQQLRLSHQLLQWSPRCCTVACQHVWTDSRGC